MSPGLSNLTILNKWSLMWNTSHSLSTHLANHLSPFSPISSISRAVEHVRARSARDKYKNKHLGQLSTRQSDYSRAADVSFITTAENRRMRHTERERKQRDVTWEERDSISHRKEQTDESRKLMRIDRNASEPVNWGAGDVSHFKSLSLHGQNWQVHENWCFVRFSSHFENPCWTGGRGSFVLTRSQCTLCCL